MMRVKTLSRDALRGRCRWRDNVIPFMKATSDISAAYPASAQVWWRRRVFVDMVLRRWSLCEDVFLFFFLSFL
jgi:hypothetical protein